jgi:hypothetical protein
MRQMNLTRSVVPNLERNGPLAFDRHYTIPLLFRKIRDKADRDNSGIIHQDVDTA